ncbi:MAG TPA: hypothetical protein VL202_24715 [Pararhizobium sp.]|uniref:hypothetical protein n=1 Tax=Pararhizobium sp. TaxID=1977563 RepID=UPI002BF9F321|nr:hypothetical protein [Pararhizobium sp.]HTO34345.1 hypothetical protein [Pararhizobium sp.]
MAVRFMPVMCRVAQGDHVRSCLSGKDGAGAKGIIFIAAKPRRALTSHHDIQAGLMTLKDAAARGPQDIEAGEVTAK